MLHSVRELFITQVARQTPKPANVIVSDGPCRNCHFAGYRGRQDVSRTAGHQVHVVNAKIRCIRCHTAGLHRFSASPDVCRQCHAQIVIRIQPMAKFHCLVCHQFTREGPSLAPTRATCLKCHANLPEKSLNLPLGAPMQFPCTICHQPHINTNPKAGCIVCHPDGVTATTPQAHKDCVICHPAHSWRFKGVQQCQGCHTPLPANVPAHKIPNHPQRFCLGCHSQHGWRFPGQVACTTCHARMKALPHPMPWIQGHQAQAKTRLAFCRTCHEANFCSDCHSRMRPQSHQLPGWPQKLHGTYSLQGKQQCSTCHAASYCSNCHGLAMPHPAGWLHAHAAPAKNRALCARCHAQSFCNTCHGGPNMMPPDHVNNWRVRHGRLALTQRARCLTCHTQRECDACHGTPMPHPAGWLPSGHAKTASFKPGNMCFRCHQPQYCYQYCHKPAS